MVPLGRSPRSSVHRTECLPTALETTTKSYGKVGGAYVILVKKGKVGGLSFLDMLAVPSSPQAETEERLDVPV